MRIVAPSVAERALVGRLVGADSQRLLVAVTKNGTALSLPLGAVEGLDWSFGRDRAAGARRGALYGFVGGALLFFSTYDQEFRRKDYFGLETILLAGSTLIVVPVIGTLIGTAAAPEAWHPVRPPVAIVAPVPATDARLRVRFDARDEIRVAADGRRLTGRVGQNTADTLTLTSGSRSTAVAWSDVSGVQIRGGRNRKVGALIGAAALIGLGVLGEAIPPTTSAGERIVAFTGAALVGAFLGSLLTPKGWVSLPLPRR